jgi:predicted nucleotidyltransferase
MSGADCEQSAARLIEDFWKVEDHMRAIQDPADAAKFAASVIRRHLPDPVYRIFLFGSRATGSAAERSDIDIGIEGPAPVPHPALAAIHDELEEAPTLFTIDVVDFRRVPEKFRKVAQQRIEL